MLGSDYNTLLSLNVHCVRLGNHKFVNCCRVMAKRRDRLHDVPRPITFCTHDVRDVNRKEALAANYCYYWQAVMGGKKNLKNQKSNMLVILFRMLCSVLEVASVVIHHDALCKIKQSIFTPDAHWSFQSPPDALRPLGWGIIWLILSSLTPVIANFPPAPQPDVVLHLPTLNAHQLRVGQNTDTVI